jgi:hypothetical protein
LKLHGTRLRLVYADDFTKEIGVKLLADKIKYMFISPDQNTG